MPMIKILLQSDEREALQKLAEVERRDPRAQAAFIIRYTLIQQGLLPDESESRTINTKKHKTQDANY